MTKQRQYYVMHGYSKELSNVTENTKEPPSKKKFSEPLEDKSGEEWAATRIVTTPEINEIAATKPKN